MKKRATLCESGKYNIDNFNTLNGYREGINSKHHHYKEQINDLMITLLHPVELQKYYYSAFIDLS